ncbi:MAG TPA: IS21 family transposase [Myxococcota bacterium]
MVEVKEVLRQWLAGTAKKRIAARLGLDVKTVRRYIEAAQDNGLVLDSGEAGLTEELLAAVLAARRGTPGRPRGDAWALCEANRERIAKMLRQGLRLSKLRKLLRRHGVSIPYATLHRFAVAELGFGRAAPTVPVADCAPGEEVQLDTGWMGTLEPDANGRRRRFRAWIFTAVYSRHRFVWPCLPETTASAIEACEAAWVFFGGVFAVVIPDNTKVIVQRADPLDPLLNPTFLEYAQARGFVVDPTRARQPRDKGRVERSVPTVRDDCFAGERLHTLVEAREHARRWCLHEYGMRRHTRTQRLPLECFTAAEKPRLRPAPERPYDVPVWCEPKVARDHFAQVAKALYSLPTRFIGRRLRARADRTLVRFYDNGALVKTHPRQPAGGRSVDRNDFPPEKTAYAMRDVAFLERQAREHGPAIGAFAAAVLAGPLPWTRMRRVYALLGLVRRYGAARVEAACVTAIAAEMHDVRRLERMLQNAASPPDACASPSPLPPARHLRPAGTYALAPTTGDHTGDS